METNPQEKWKIVFIFGVLAYFFSDLYSMFSYRAWFADGAHCFLRLLSTQRHVSGEPARIFGEVFLQQPVLIAIKCGVRNVSVLSFLFSAPLFLQLSVSLFLCYWTTGETNRQYLLFPLISLFAGLANGSLMIISPALFMVSLYWVLLFFMIFQGRFGLWRSLIFSILAFISLRTYESMFYFGFVLGGVAIWRALRQPRFLGKLIWLGAAGCFFCGACMAFKSVLLLAHSGTFAHFRESISSFLGDPFTDWTFHHTALLSVAALVLLLLSLIKRKWFEFPFRILLFCYVVFAVMMVLIPALFPFHIMAECQYRARTFYSFLPFFLSLTMFWVMARPSHQTNNRWTRAFLIVSILAFSQIAWQILATSQWQKYLTLFRSSLRNKHGLIDIHQTPLMPANLRRQGIASMGWSWTYPTMSILLAPRGKIRAIIDAKKLDDWAPFNANDPLQWPDLSAYGFVYEVFDSP